MRQKMGTAQANSKHMHLALMLWLLILPIEVKGIMATATKRLVVSDRLQQQSAVYVQENCNFLTTLHAAHNMVYSR